jgi:hypothetical protein
VAGVLAAAGVPSSAREPAQERAFKTTSVMRGDPEGGVDPSGGAAREGESLAAFGAAVFFATFAASRWSQLLTVDCGTSWRRAASTTPTSSTAFRISTRFAVVYLRRFLGSAASLAIFVLVETSTHPQVVQGFRPRSPWKMFGTGK